MILNLFTPLPPEQNRGLSGVKKKNDKKIGFTLAETLICLGIIGVVAVLVIPSMTASIQARVRERQVQVSKVKFNKAAQLMALNNALGPYYSDTYDFIQNLGKYLKINLVCRVGDNPSDLSSFESCLGDNYNIVKTTEGEEVEISSLGSGGSSFGIKDNDDKNDWSSPSLAFYTIDGVRYILSYNSKCPEVAAGVYQGNAASGCIAGLVDVDGDKKPNQLGKDVYLIGSAKSIGKTCIGKTLSLCFSAPLSLVDIVESKGYVTRAECEANKSKWGLPDNFCYEFSSDTVNYQWFASLVRECGGLNKMASAEDISKMVNYIYGIDSYIAGVNGNGVFGLTYDDSTAARVAEFGLPDYRNKDSGIQIINSELTSSSNGFWTYESQLLSNVAIRVGYTTSNPLSWSHSTTEDYFFCKL